MREDRHLVRQGAGAYRSALAPAKAITIWSWLSRQEQ